MLKKLPDKIYDNREDTEAEYADFSGTLDCHAYVCYNGPDHFWMFEDTPDKLLKALNDWMENDSAIAVNKITK